MITRYDIGFENKNIVLIVNLDFFYEFSNFDYKEKSKDLKKEIIKIANKNGAKKIKIVIGGVLLSTLLLLPNNTFIEDKPTNFITKDTIKESFNKIPDEIIIIDVSKEDNKVNNTQNQTINKHINTTQTLNKPINNQIMSNPTNIQDTKPNKSIEKENTKPTTNEVIKEEKVDNNIYVKFHRRNGSIISLELEEYLIGVVSSEMPASFNIEALKAQAVVARTYALKKTSEGKILTDTVSTQSYKDNNELKSIWGNNYDKYYNKIKNAVNLTKGIVITYNNKYIDAVYHSTSNGKTEDAIYVWGNDIPYLKSVDSSYDKNVSSYERKKEFTLEEISNILDSNITSDTLFILERNTSNRVTNIKFNDIEVCGTTFRNLLGLRSTDFNIETNEKSIVITTYGYGHGVGMSQYGANEMAKLGYTYENILKHYYKNITIKKIR